MVKRGRKSAADTLTVVHFKGYRPDAPYTLGDEQAAIWNAVVEAMPDGWFRPETHDILAAYCRHVCRERFISTELDSAEQKHLSTVEGASHFNALAKACERESRMALAAARALRLTPQSRTDPQTAFRKVRDEPVGPKPWEAPKKDPA